MNSITKVILAFVLSVIFMIGYLIRMHYEEKELKNGKN